MTPVRTLLLSFVVAGLSLGCAESPRRPAPRTLEERATYAAQDFAEAFNDRQIDRLLQVSKLPWHFDSTFTFETRQELEEHFRQAVEVDAPIFTTTVRSVRRYRDLRPAIGKEFKRQMLDDVLQPEDFLIGLQSAEDPNYAVLVLVALDGDNAQVVGMVHE